MRVIRNQQYVVREETPPRRNRLDIYLPAKADTLEEISAVIFVHGGAWKTGDKVLVNNKSAWLTANGIALVSINYRFWPDVTYKEQASDVANSVAWTRNNADRFGIDSNRIFLMGHSAGAHLVALTGTNPKYLGLYDLKSTDLAGVIPIDGGGLHVPLQLEMAESKRRIETYESVFSQDGNTQRDASPFFHLRKDREYPPFLVVHVANRHATTMQAEKFAEKLAFLNGDVEVFAGTGKTHLSINRDIGVGGDPTTNRILGFIEKHVD